MSGIQSPLFIFGICIFVIVIFTHVATTIRDQRRQFEYDVKLLDRQVLVELYELRNRCPEIASEVTQLIELWRDKKNIES